MRTSSLEIESERSVIRFNRFLPYWAVLQTDLRQTLRSWVYRLWVLMIVVASGGYLLYSVGLHKEAGMVQAASLHTQNLLRGLLIASIGLVALLAVSSIASERASVADAVLSRGISRYQYFLAKWHARLFVIVGTFLTLGAFILGLHYFFLDPDMTLSGSLVALGLAAAVLVVVISWGVTIGALANGTVIAITLFWMLLYGGIVVLSLLPSGYPSPERALQRLPLLLRGQFHTDDVTQLLLFCLVTSLIAAVVGLVGFARKDV